MIDLTLLSPTADAAGIEALCAQAARYGFATVCVNPRWVARAATLLADAAPGVCTVVGFPLGASTTAVKVFEAEDALTAGASEIDVVIDLAAVRARDTDALQSQLGALARTVHPRGLLKVIIETCLLTPQEIRFASAQVMAAGADFVKTSTGFSTGGATVEAVRQIRSEVGPDMGIKAAGGIHTPEQMDALVAAGATRIGASDGVALL